MTWSALGFTLLFVVVTMLVSVWKKLGLERDIAIATVRAAAQLLAVGYVLHFVFHSEKTWLLVAIIVLMIGIASWNAAQKVRELRGAVWRIAIAIAFTEGLLMSILLGLGIVDATAQYIIPLSGMSIGSSMIAAGLFFHHLNREVQSSRGEIETLLALGATAKQAIQISLKRSVKFSMIPTIDAMKTVGLVQLPGMMTGMIVAGADPVEAVRYQILIAFSLACSTAVMSMLLSQFCYRLWFTKDLRVR
jgi:putative ABC transport system permease protein